MVEAAESKGLDVIEAVKVLLLHVRPDEETNRSLQIWTELRSCTRTMAD